VAVVTGAALTIALASGVAGSAVRSGDTTGETAAQRIAVPLAAGGGGEGSAGIALFSPSGRRIAMLTQRRSSREDSEPAWSPDGKQVAFTRTADARRSFQIYVIRADGTGARRITTGRFDTSPAWSPDGRWIAYVSDRQLRIVHPDGSGGRTVPTRSPSLPTYPVWAPGGRIAYSYWEIIPMDRPPACRQAGSGCGYVVSSRLDGSQRRLVVRGRDAHWSPDGHTILFTGPDGGVYTAPASGGGSRFLGRGYLADWSRDGQQIIYARMGDRPALDSVWIMDRDGRNAHSIVRGGSNPAWRP
jgi:Tol biopolymer transport system component